MAEHAISPQQAASALSDLRTARDAVSARAAGLSLMMWALVVTSMAGTVVAYGLVRFQAGLGDGSWALFMASIVALIAFWVAVGAVVQRLIWRSFATTPASGKAAWKAPVLAFAVALACLVGTMVVQDAVRDLQGIGQAPDQYDELHHNLGAATALWIGGSVIVAISLVQDRVGMPRRQGVLVGAGTLLLGHLLTLLWVPDVGWSGVVVAALALPFGLIAYGLHLWRQG